jgi:hypothetical protein
MTITSYTKPSSGDYRLVRIRAVKSQILEPEVLGRILSILERDGEQELWDALYRSQPFHSEQVDESGAYWRQGRFYATDDNEIRKAFPHAAAKGLV